MDSTYKTLLDTCNSHNVTLVAVSKTKPVSLIQEFYEMGHRDFGENKVQELTTKAEKLPTDIRWHQIGHLQRNKVKYIAPFVHLIHAVDSLKLLKEVNKQAKKNDRVIDCLLQMHIAEEDSKFGFSSEELDEMFDSDVYPQLENVRIKGLMGMATFTDNKDQVRREFKQLKSLFEQLKSGRYSGKDHFDTLSMGMSGDYQIALEEGSTMIRVGSLLFGERNY
ncbi:MAG: YggS family pyridoxal phosphate-dependent enzyme [Bacteroidetes bacterium]|nr:YggS family pyridoxal phosphate-dependent enzyme [Bacteroidota bacterium]